MATPQDTGISWAEVVAAIGAFFGIGGTGRAIQLRRQMDADPPPCTLDLSSIETAIREEGRESRKQVAENHKEMVEKMHQLHIKILEKV